MTKTKTGIDRATFGIAVAVAFATLAAISCAKGSGVGSSPAADDTGQVTSAPSSGAVTPASSGVANVATQNIAVPAGTAPAGVPVPQVETRATLPTPAVLQAVSAAQGKLDALTAVLAGTKVRFVACEEGAACTARVEAQTLTGLRDLLQSVSAQHGGIGFSAREQLDGYTGHSYVADVTLGGPEARPVPNDENALLVN